MSDVEVDEIAAAQACRYWVGSKNKGGNHIADVPPTHLAHEAFLAGALWQERFKRENRKKEKAVLIDKRFRRNR